SAMFAVVATILLTSTMYTQGQQDALTPGAGQGGRGGQGGQGGQGGRGRGPRGTPGPPSGVQPLPIDVFTSKNFYKDKANWLDKRYYRCNIPRDLEQFWANGRVGDNPPTSATWGDCNADLKREDILSPYPYKTAQEHYNALLAAAKAKGGPTVYTRATLPD